jgi:adenylate cyclase
MGMEIERKFLLSSDAWRAGAKGTRYRQGYLRSSADGCTVRVRSSGRQAFLTLKGRSSGAARAEFEYEIPLADAEEILDTLCGGPLIEKTRYCVEFGGLTWEIDEFHGDNAGLVLAEVELEREDQQVSLPPWVGREVTGDGRYYNASLVRNPYRKWGGREEPVR